jgi:hypothetical protein
MGGWRVVMEISQRQQKRKLNFHHPSAKITLLRGGKDGDKESYHP